MAANVQTRLDALKASAEDIRNRRATHEANLKVLDERIEEDAAALRMAGFPIDDGVEAVKTEIATREAALEAQLAEAEQQAAQGKAILDRIESGGEDNGI